MTDQTLDHSRRAIAGLLPEAMERAVASYREFATADVSLDVKIFKDHHAAARVALAHLEALLRLARWAAAADDHGDDHSHLAGLVEDARHAVADLIADADPLEAGAEP